MPKAGGTEEVLASGTDRCFQKMTADANVVVWRSKINGCTGVNCFPVFKLAK